MTHLTTQVVHIFSKVSSIYLQLDISNWSPSSSFPSPEDVFKCVSKFRKHILGDHTLDLYQNYGSTMKV